MSSQDPQAGVTPLRTLWDSRDVPIHVPEDCTWGIPKEMMPDVRRLLAEYKAPVPEIGQHFSLEDFQHLISFLYRNRSDEVSLNNAIAEEIAALNDKSKQENGNPPRGVIPPLNGHWVLIVGDLREKLEGKQEWLADAIGSLLAANGYGLLYGGWPGVDEITARAFRRALEKENLSVSERMRQLVADRVGGWKEKSLEIASSFILIGGEGSTYEIFEDAKNSGVPVIPVRDSGEDADVIFRELVDGEGAVPFRDILVQQQVGIDTKDDSIRRAREVLDILNQIVLYASLTKERFIEEAEKEEARRSVIFVDDIQRGRWGRSAASNDYVLYVDFHPRSDGEIIVAVVVRRHGFPAPRHWVSFYYQLGRNQQQVKVTSFNDYAASIEFNTRHACTVGAYLEDGTVLELDLNEVTGAPPSFYYTAPPDSFRELVSERYRKNKIKVKNDIQKNRWGGKSKNNGNLLNARVTRTKVDAEFEVTLEVLAESHRQPLTGWVAFFVPSIPEIVYDEVKENTKGGIASITVNAEEAFTVGAMTQDGTQLELDLQQLKGFPSEFYYEKRKPKIERSNTKNRTRPKKK